MICVVVLIFNSPCRVMTKDNIALAALLQTKEACWEGGVPPDHKVRRSLEEKNLELLLPLPHLDYKGCGAADSGLLCPHPLGPGVL